MPQVFIFSLFSLEPNFPLLSFGRRSPTVKRLITGAVVIKTVPSCRSESERHCFDAATQKKKKKIGCSHRKSVRTAPFFTTAAGDLLPFLSREPLSLSIETET